MKPPPPRVPLGGLHTKCGGSPPPNRAGVEVRAGSFRVTSDGPLRSLGPTPAPIATALRYSFTPPHPQRPPTVRPTALPDRQLRSKPPNSNPRSSTQKGSQNVWWVHCWPPLRPGPADPNFLLRLPHPPPPPSPSAAHHLQPCPALPCPALPCPALPSFPLPCRDTSRIHRTLQVCPQVFSAQWRRAPCPPRPPRSGRKAAPSPPGPRTPASIPSHFTPRSRRPRGGPRLPPPLRTQPTQRMCPTGRPSDDWSLRYHATSLSMTPLPLGTPFPITHTPSLTVSTGHLPRPKSARSPPPPLPGPRAGHSAAGAAPAVCVYVPEPTHHPNAQCQATHAFPERQNARKCCAPPMGNAWCTTIPWGPVVHFPRQTWRAPSKSEHNSVAEH